MVNTSRAKKDTEKKPLTAESTTESAVGTEDNVGLRKRRVRMGLSTLEGKAGERPTGRS